MRELDFGEYKLVWKKDIHPTPGALAACQAICIMHFGDAGLTGFGDPDKKETTPAENAKAQIAIKKVLDDRSFLEILDEVFVIDNAKVDGPENYSSRNKVPLSDVINAPVIDGSGIDIKKLHILRAKLVNFLSVG